MHTKHSLFISLSGLFTAALSILVVIGQAGPASALKIEGSGKSRTGTFLSIENDGATILQINRDRNFRLITSSQFKSGVLDAPFSNTWGSWRRSGPRELTGTSVNITFESGDGIFVGVAAATYKIQFSGGLRSVRVTCKGEIFPPGVAPFSPGAEPISGSQFTCGEEGLLFHRLPGSIH